MIAKVAYSMSLIDIQIYLFNALGTNIALSHPQTHSTSNYINYQILQNTSLFLKKSSVSNSTLRIYLSYNRGISIIFCWFYHYDLSLKLLSSLSNHFIYFIFPPSIPSCACFLLTSPNLLSLINMCFVDIMHYLHNDEQEYNNCF
jgi:hypothetical protein